ncbi:MAG TPA: amino acid adenylation domain-containing protein, partial [Terriglobales bacterium]|nr:amino acid adenylation domain-containing protein [Terriglobales bacterium]
MDLVAALLAISKSGAAYLPLEPEAPAARQALCIQNASPWVILTDMSAPDLPQVSTPIIYLESLIEAGSGRELPAASVSPDDLAYVINTSGTTGVPKGVEIRHRGLVNELISFQKEPGFTAADRMLAIATASFDIAGLEFFLPLVSGGSLVLQDRAVALDPHLLMAAIDESQCTVMQATPATWLSLLSAGWKGPGRPLKALCGGEPMSRELANALLDRGIELWNVYGPTETTIWATVHRVRRGTAPISIGKPIANMTAFVLDARRQLVPAGVPGVLHIGGVGLARGYHRNSQATADRFIHVEAVGDDLLYDTGDIVVQRPDGTLECRGRADNQVKVRGYRIELEAVEAAVRRHPQVGAAAARVWPDATGSNRLSVYLVGKEGPPPDTSALRRFLKQDQPEWMIPSDVVAMDALPLSLTNKVDRSKLPAPSIQQDTLSAGELKTSCEQRLATIWCEVLKVPAVDRNDNFFDLGGHSLMLAALAQRIEAAFESRLSIATLFHVPTVQGQAALLEQAQSSATVGLFPLQPDGARPPLFWLHPPAHIVHLTEALGRNQPVFGVGLTEPDLEKLGPSPSMESIAALHAQAILAAQPHGPLFLAGLCTGGIVAFETAAQLQAAGHQVALLILLDAQNPVFYRRIGSLSVELSKAYFYLKQAMREARPQNRATLQQRFIRLITLRKEIWPPSMVPIETVLGQHMTDAAAYRYKPPLYSGDVLLLQAKDRPHRVDHTPGWRTVVAGTLMTREVDGHHDELLHRENAGALA